MNGLFKKKKEINNKQTGCLKSLRVMLHARTASTGVTFSTIIFYTTQTEPFRRALHSSLTRNPCFEIGL